jgi:S1-C subfamily serine protease
VISGSAADRAAVKSGDVLVILDEYETTKLEDISYVLNLPEVKKVERVVFYVVRNDKLQKGFFELTR